MKKLIYTAVLIALAYAASAQIPVATWHPVGPILFPINGSGQINGMGRVTKVKYDPVNPHKMYATSASGGLWISYDDGTSWRGTGTDMMPYHKEATVCIDYTDTNIIYLGTGDPNYYNAGQGVWKSTDGGATFTQSDSGMGNVLVDELLMNPTNDSVLVAVTNNGIYKTYTAGKYWVHKMSSGQFTDMDFKPGSNGRVIYACTRDSMYRSDDAGETWVTVTAGFYIPGGAGGQGLRTAVTPADTNIVFLGMVANRGSLFKSNDGGHSFQVVKDSFALSITGYSTTDGGQGDYNFDFNIDPIDTNTIYWVSHNTWRSTLGGIPSSWQLLTHWWEIVHTDMHHITFDPNDLTHIYNANDGGVWLSTDSGANWSPKSDGLDATEIAPAASSRIDLNTISIGTQDNGELYYNQNWITNRGGDWYEYMAYDYSNPKTVYYANGNRRIVSQGDQTLGLPLANDYYKILFTPANTNVAFIGKDTILRTFDLNDQPPVWQTIAIFPGKVNAMALSPVDSNKLFIITNNDTLHISNNAMSASPTFTSYRTPAGTSAGAGILVIDDQPNVVYMYNSSKIYVSTDTGTTWTAKNSSYPFGVNIVGMVHDKYTTDQSVFLANDNEVFYSNMNMPGWQDYSTGLPMVAHIQGLDMFDNGSPYSALRVPYYGRGLWEAAMNTNKVVVANFSSDVQYICAGDSVHFYDSTYNHPTFWNWSFPGGTPSSSFVQNPVVAYPASGTYPVTLTAGNSTSSTTKTIVAYINVPAIAIDSMPVTQGFEDTIFPPAGWTNVDGGGDGAVWQRTNYGAYGQSTHSMVFVNYGHNERGLTKSMRFGTSFTDLDSVLLTFDVAYQRSAATGYNDSLEVAVSVDCGQSFQRVFINGGAALATAPLTPAPFYPTAGQWKTDTISLNQFSLRSPVIVSFNNISDYGDNIYVDNINLHGTIKKDTVPTGIESIQMNDHISIYPNPTKGLLNIAWNEITGDKIKVSLMNVVGEKVKEINIPVSGQGSGSSSIDISGLTDGIYYVKAENGSTLIAKIILMK